MFQSQQCRGENLAMQDWLIVRTYVTWQLLLSLSRFDLASLLELEHIHCLLDWLICFCYGLKTVHNLLATNSWRTEVSLKFRRWWWWSQDEGVCFFPENVSECKKLNQLPVPIMFGEDIDVENLVQHQAKWHKLFYLKFNDTKLHRARKCNVNKSSDDGTTLRKPRL